MANNIVFTTKDLLEGLQRMAGMADDATHHGINDVATEVLRLSEREVPHDKGLLQNSGMIEDVSKLESIVGYNKEYAAYQHEGRRFDGTHVIKNYQRGRKGKYLEDPIKNNLSVFNRILGERLQFDMRFI
jgi:hypothetical protein